MCLDLWIGPQLNKGHDFPSIWGDPLSHFWADSPYPGSSKLGSDLGLLPGQPGVVTMNLYPPLE